MLITSLIGGELSASWREVDFRTRLFQLDCFRDHEACEENNRRFFLQSLSQFTAAHRLL